MIYRYRMILAGCIGLLGILVVAYVVRLYLLVPPEVVAEQFLATIGKPRIGDAYAATSPTYQTLETEATFKQTVTRWNLQDYAGVDWTNSEVSDTGTALDGKVRLLGGVELPVHVGLEKQGIGLWQVTSMSVNATPEILNRQTPQITDTAGMVRIALGLLSRSMQTDDYHDLYVNGSRMMQDQFTPEQLRQAFLPMKLAGVDLSGIEKQNLTFSPPPSVGPDGLLHAVGSLSLNRQQWFFAVAYDFEHPVWKLFSIALSTEPIR